MINGQNFFDQPVKSNLRTYDDIPKISTGEGDDLYYNQIIIILINTIK